MSPSSGCFCARDPRIGQSMPKPLSTDRCYAYSSFAERRHMRMSKPTLRVLGPGNARAAQISIGRVVLRNTLASVCYTVVVLIAAEGPASIVGRAIQTWIAFTAHLADAALFVAPSPSISAASSQQASAAEYRHLLFACGVMAIWSVAASRVHRPVWARVLRARLGIDKVAGRGARSILVFAYRTTMLGVVAVVLLMLFGEPHLHAASLPYVRDLALLMAPALAAIACGLGCRAVALRYALTEQQ
jgi:hypothetical protein